VVAKDRAQYSSCPDAIGKEVEASKIRQLFYLGKEAEREERNPFLKVFLQTCATKKDF